MWYWILILLYLHVSTDHAAHNDAIANAVEKKTAEGKDRYLVHSVVKRAVDDDGNSSITNSTETVTNSNQSIVLEYITSQGVGQNLSDDVSVNQLNGTSTINNPVTTDTQMNSSAVTKTTDNLNDTVTESVVSKVGSTSTAATQTRTDVTFVKGASSTNSSRSVTTLNEYTTTPVTPVNIVTDTSHSTVAKNTKVSTAGPKKDNATENFTTEPFNMSISTANPSLSSVTSVSSPVLSSPLSTSVDVNYYSKTTHSQVTNTSLAGPVNVTESSHHINDTQTVMTSNVMSSVPITTSASSVPLTPATSTSMKTVSYEQEVVSTDFIKNTTVLSTTQSLKPGNSTSLEQPVNSSLISTTQLSIVNVTDTAIKLMTTSDKGLTEDSGHGENHTVSGTPTTTSLSTTSKEDDSEIPLSEPEPSPEPADSSGGYTNSSEHNNSTVAQPTTQSVNITFEQTQAITQTEKGINGSTAQSKTFSTTVHYNNTTIVPLSQTTSYEGPVKNSSTAHQGITTSKPEEKTSVITPKVEKTSTNPEAYATAPTKESNPTTETPPLSHQLENDTLTFKPSPEPETESSTQVPTPEPEKDNPTGEPESETDPVGSEEGFNFDVFAEPGPDWPVAKLEWKQAWEFHIYFFGISFTLLGLYCLFCVIQLWKMDHLLSRHYFITLQVLVMLICLFRASYLLIDAYNSLATFPIVLDYFMYSTVFPCLTAVFSILFYALLLAVRVRVLSEKVQKLWVLLLITGLHFALSFVTDIIVGLFSTAAVMLLICQSFFIFWGLIIFIGYLVIFKKLYQSAINRQETLRRNSMHDRKNNITQGFQEKPPTQKYRLGLAVKVTLVSSFFGLACVCFELYGMFGVYGLMRTDKPKPWPWWAYHTIVRCLEIAMCSSIAYVASQPLKYTYKKKYKDKVCLKALPCRYLCCADLSTHRDEASMSMDQYATSETDHLGWLKKLKSKKCSLPDTSAPYPPHTAEKYTDPDATLLVRKVSKPKPSMLVVEDGFVRIRREDEMVQGNQYDLDSNSISSRSSDVNNVSASPFVNYNVNETKKDKADIPHTSRGVSNAAFAQDDKRSSFNDNNFRVSFHGDNRISIQGDMEHFNDIADETDIDIAVTDCENSDGYETPAPASDENSGNSGDIFRPLSDIDLAASMESELERAFHSRHGAETDNQPRHRMPGKYSKTYKKPYTGSGYNENSHTEDDWSDSSDGASRTPNSGLLKRPIRRCKSEDSKEQQLQSKMFDNNRYFSLSSLDSVGKQDALTETFVQKL